MENGQNETSQHGFTICSVIFGIISLGFFPPLFGTIGVILGAIGMSRKENYAIIGIVISLVSMIIGMIMGTLVFSLNS